MNEVAKFVLELVIVAISFFIGLVSLFLGLRSIRFIKVNIEALNQQNETALKQNETTIEQNKIALRQNETAIKSERNERFKNAIEQLGNDKNAIVLGGIYTLHRIAKEDDSYIENVFNILCAFVRDTTTAEDYQGKYTEKPSEPIQTILNILCVKKEDLEVYRPLESKLRIDFHGAYLRKANLTGANLTDAYLYRVDLIGACLCLADLTGADLPRANLTGASLRNATLTGADLDDTNLKGAYSSENIIYDSFEERIKSRIGKETDLREIIGGYNPENPQFKSAIIGSYTAEDADKIIKDYNDSRSLTSITN